jgi:ornithine carbamoyltransferase
VLVWGEASGKPYDRVAYAFCGDCRFNMGRSLLVTGALLGIDVRLASPAELHPPKHVVQLAEDIAGRTGARITITEDPALAISGVDFIHTDVWVSMGESKDVWAERVRMLAPYQVNADLMRKCTTRPSSSCAACPRSTTRTPPSGARSWSTPA